MEGYGWSWKVIEGYINRGYIPRIRLTIQVRKVMVGVGGLDGGVVACRIIVFQSLSLDSDISIRIFFPLTSYVLAIVYL